MPRHPPCALKKQHTHICKQKIPRTKKNKDYYSRPLYSSHTTQPPTTPTTTHTGSPPAQQAATRINTTVHHPRHPTACQHNKQHFPQSTQHTITQPCTATNCKQHTITHNTDPPGLKKINNKHQPVPIEKQKLLRKEVIQPHLPVRLPCYDFVPIADPTFDHSPQKLVGPWASGVTNFHDVTGGVYKARERIHRSVADLRLLATPTSWGRVADPNPN